VVPRGREGCGAAQSRCDHGASLSGRSPVCFRVPDSRGNTALAWPEGPHAMMVPQHTLLLRALQLERKRLLRASTLRASRMRVAGLAGPAELDAARDALRDVDMGDDVAIQAACRRVHMAVEASRARWGERRVAP